MNRVRLVRFVVAAAVVSAAAATFAQPVAGPRDDDTVSVSTTYPTNAAKIFKWGNAQWVDEFEDPLKSMWAVNRKSQVRNQHGMLTLEAPATGGDTIARLTGHGRQYGRWEARVRGRNYGTSGTAYHAVWELTPTSDYHCGARSIVLSDYAARHEQGRHARAQAAEPRLHGEQATRRWPTTSSTPTPSRSLPTTSRGSSTPR